MIVTLRPVHVFVYDLFPFVENMRFLAYFFIRIMHGIIGYIVLYNVIYVLFP